MSDTSTSGSERPALPDAGVAATGYVCQNFSEHPDEEVEMVSSGPGEGGVICPECGRMAGGPDDEIPYGDPPEYATDGGTDVDDTDRDGAIVRGFHIRGMEPQRNIYDFQITIDAEFADELRSLDVRDKQEPSADHIKGALTHDMADVRFVGDSFLLRGITVGFQATGLDLFKEELGRQSYATHNVDAPCEAIEVVAAFSRWEELANHLLEDRREDDELPADGGSVRVCESTQGRATCPECGTFDWVEDTKWPVASEYDDYDLACLRCEIGFNRRSVGTGTDRLPMLPWCRDCWDQSGDGTKQERDGELPDECQHCGSSEVFWI